MFRIHTLISRCLLLLALPLVAAPPAKAIIYISGRVFNSATGAPTPGVGVSLFAEGAGAGSTSLSWTPAASTQSLQNGAYVLVAPETGKYRVVAAVRGFLPMEPVVTLSHKGIAGVNLGLAPVRNLLLVVQGPDGKPVARGTARGWIWLLWGNRTGMVLGLNNRGGNRHFSNGGGVRFRGDGNIQIPGPRDVPLQDITAGLIEVSVPGIGIGSAKITGWTENPVTITLKPGAIVTGTVMDKTGKPLVGAAVLALRTSPEAITFDPNRIRNNSVLTDQKGSFTLGDLTHDSYILRVAHPAIGEQYYPVVVSQDAIDVTSILKGPSLPPSQMGGGSAAYEGQIPLAAVLERLGQAGVNPTVPVSGRVVDSETGAPIAGARVSLYGANPFGQYGMGESTPLFGPFDESHSDDSGRFQLRGLSGATYGLRVEVDDYLVSQTILSTSQHSRTPVVVRVRQLHPVLVVPVDAAGKKITGNNVQGYVVVDWGATLVEADATPPNADGKLLLQPPALELPLGEASRNEPRQVIIGVRSPESGYAEQHLQSWPRASLQLTLRHAPTLSGTVVDEAGKPLPFIPLSITRTAHTPGPGIFPELPIFAPTRSDSNGKFTVTALPPGTYSILETYHGNTFRAFIVHLTAAGADVIVKPVVR